MPEIRTFRHLPRRALARFEEISREGEATPPRSELASCFANAATRFNDRLVKAWAARDWETVAALHARTAYTDDRRRLMRLKTELNVAWLRTWFAIPNSRFVITPIATRGERLALSRCGLHGTIDEPLWSTCLPQWPQGRHGV